MLTTTPPTTLPTANYIRYVLKYPYPNGLPDRLMTARELVEWRLYKKYSVHSGWSDALCLYT